MIPPPPHWILIGSQCSIVPPLHSVGNDRSSLVTPPPPPVIDNNSENLMVYLTPLIQTTT